MGKTKKPEQAIFYQNFKGAIYGGTPEQVKNLMSAFCQYAFDGVDNPKVAPDIAMTFGMMKASIDADRKHYCVIRRFAFSQILSLCKAVYQPRCKNRYQQHRRK